MWRALKGKLPVRAEVDKRGIDLHSILCPLCEDEIESVEYSLLKCKVVKAVWEKVFSWWKIDGVVSTVSEVFKHEGMLNWSTSKRYIWRAVVWSAGYILWRGGNNSAFKNVRLNPMGIFLKFSCCLSTGFL